MPNEHILVVDDDAGTRFTSITGLGLAGFAVTGAATAEAALGSIRATVFDLAIIDLRLPDMLGIDLMMTVREFAPHPDLMLMSAFLTTSVIVEAMKLGAVDVFEKPFDLHELIERVRMYCRSKDYQYPRTRQFESVLPKGSTTDRLARLILRSCEAESDLKTIAEWARFIGMSYAALSELCRIVHIQPHDARDFVRMLRAVMQARSCQCDPEAMLDVSDRRTLKALLRRANIAECADPPSIEAYIVRQQFIDPGNAVVKVLRSLLRG